jgi:hypothetical protein
MLSWSLFHSEKKKCAFAEKHPKIFIKSIPPRCLQNTSFDASSVLHPHNMLPSSPGKLLLKTRAAFSTASFLHAGKQEGGCGLQGFVFCLSSSECPFWGSEADRSRHREWLPFGVAWRAALSARASLQLQGLRSLLALWVRLIPVLSLACLWSDIGRFGTGQAFVLTKKVSGPVPWWGLPRVRGYPGIKYGYTGIKNVLVEGRTVWRVTSGCLNVLLFFFQRDEQVLGQDLLLRNHSQNRG